MHAALAAARELAPLAAPHRRRSRSRACSRSGRRIAGAIADDDPFASRERRARAAIVDMLAALAAVHAAHDDPAWTIDDLGIAVRRWIGEQTFVRRRSDAPARGVHLLDDQAVALRRLRRRRDRRRRSRPDWPERPRRNIFYPPALLKSLGWPSEKDRRAAADARFLDLLASASRRTLVSTFTLDDEALVTRSMQLDEMPRARLSTVASAPIDEARVFVDEALSLEPVALDALDGDARSGPSCDAAARRPTRPSSTAPSATRRSRAWSVSALETYLDCPFKFFAQHVLKLEEEPDDEEVMDPRRQGQFVHDVFETFFKAWQARRAPRDHAAATSTTRARLFTAVVDRALERAARSRGRRSSARACSVRRRRRGSARRCSAWKPNGPSPVVERLLEHRLDGDVHDRDGRAVRATIALRGKADRLDLLADGTFRLIDYKLGWPPNRARALQLPIYGLCAEQRLAGHRGRQLDARRSGVPRVQGTAAGGAAVFDAGRSRRRCSPTRSSGWPTPSTRSSAASSRRRRTTCIAARRAASRRSAGRTMSAMSEPTLPFDDDEDAVEADPPLTVRDVDVRDRRSRASLVGPVGVADLARPARSRARDAVDPSQNVVLEASAGTGKTRVLVERYVNLLRAGVEPDHILAITFTRKAAAEMRAAHHRAAAGSEPALASSTRRAGAI